MLVSVERLLTRIRQPASRADELNALRARLREELAKNISTEERDLAQSVRAKKLAVSAELEAVTSCRSCAKGQPLPVGHHAGGACCSGVTADLFEESELAALAHAGTRPADLTPPAGSDVHAGCAFRGPRGCTLDASHRPARCIHYFCDTIKRELHKKGELVRLEAKLGDLATEMKKFKSVHAARLDREVLEPLIAALEATARR
jgi:hypothetical protein